MDLPKTLTRLGGRADEADARAAWGVPMRCYVDRLVGQSWWVVADKIRADDADRTIQRVRG